MLLMLVRHGKAQERGEVPDALRALTEEGKEKLERAYPLLAPALKERSVRLITSPLVRARQTAEVLGNVLGISAQMEDWVCEGNIRALLRAAAQTEEDVLIVVGHEPTFSYWSQRLGLGIEWLKKGAATLFAVDEGIRPLGYFPLGEMRELAGEIARHFA